MQADPTTIVRRLGPEDVQAYRELMLHAYEVSPANFTSTRREREQLPLDWWANRLSDAPAASEAVFGGFAGQRLIGVCGLLRQSGDKTSHKVKILGMFVVERSRGSGLGAALLSATISYARELPGTTVAQLTVSRGNKAAIKLYENNGFTAFGVEPKAVALENHYVDKIHMWREL